MRRFGNISTAIGFIFLGIVWIIYPNDKVLAYDIVKLWPGIFILIGLEFIIDALRRSNIKSKFNWVCILVVIMLIFSYLIIQMVVTDFNGEVLKEYIN